jgi:hypothetical protein
LKVGQEALHGVLFKSSLSSIRRHVAATIRPGDGILSQKAGQSRHVPGLTGGKKTEQKLALALRLGLETRALVLQRLPGPMKQGMSHLFPLEHLFVGWYNHGGLTRWRSSCRCLPILLIG